MVLELVAKIVQIILIDIVLSGDNAVVIAMAAHKLPDHQRKRAILWGGAIAIIMRIVFTLVMAFLLMVPGVRLIGGIVLVWIACKLLLGEAEEPELDAAKASRSTWAAIRMIFVADFVMSLDNMLAVAGAAGEEWWMIVMGLLVSIVIIMFFSSIIANLMNRYRWIVYLGAAILAFTAGEMMLGDRELAHYIAVTHRISLNKKWEDDFMVTHANVSNLKGADNLPADLKDVVRFRPGELEFIGQITEAQRVNLGARTDVPADKKAIDAIYEISHRRDVPDWVPLNLRPRVENWFQRRWPASVWMGIQGRQYNFVAWIFFGVVVVFCLALPRVLLRRKGPPAASPEQPEPAKV
jgi:YjbE family integral membrane protein